MKTVITWIKEWKTRSLRTAAVVALVLYTLGGFFVVPLLVKNSIEKQSLSMIGRQASVETVRWNPFSLSLTIEGFSLPDRPGSILVGFDSLYANAQVSSLFRWAATLKELTVDNLQIGVRRFPDGTVNILEVKDFLDQQPTKDEEQGWPRAMFQKITINGGQLAIEDHDREEPLVWNWEPIEFTLHNISTIPDERGDNAGTIGLPSGGSIAASGSVVIDPFGLEGSITLKEMSLKTAWRAVEDFFDFELTHGEIDTDLRYNLILLEDGPHIQITELNADISDLGFSTLGADINLLTVDSVAAHGITAAWPEREVHGESIIVTSPSIFAWIEEDGTRAWDELVPEETQERMAETYQTLEEKLDLKAALDRFEVQGAEAVYEDRQQDPPIRFEASGTEIVVTDISTRHGSSWPFESSTLFSGQARGSATGHFGASPLTFRATVDVGNLDLAKFQPYIALFAPVDLRAGLLFAQGEASAASHDDGYIADYRGSFGVKDLDLKETLTGDTLIGWGDLSVEGLAANLQPMTLDITNIDISGAGLEVTIAPDGRIHLLEFLNALSEGQDHGPSAGDPARGGLPPTRVARLQLHDCYGHFSDQTLDEPFVLKVTDVNGTVSGIATQSKAGAEVNLNGAIDSGGLLRVQGQIDAFDYSRLTDLDLDLRDIRLPAMSPMSIKFIGHPLVHGKAALDLDYDIADGALVGANHIEADDLELGDRVPGEGMLDLPFKLGVALLKDKEGRIVLDIPLKGHLQDEGFGLGTAVEAAVKEVISALVASPFQLLSKIGGSGDEDLEYVEFAAGSSTLDDRAIANLQVLAAALNDRPTLKLQIHGGVSASADTEAFKRAALHAELMSQGVTLHQLDTFIPVELLAPVYQSRFSPEDLATLEASHTTPSIGLDENAFRQDLIRQLTASQPVESALVQTLGPARAQSIRTVLVEQANLNGERITVAPETVVQDTDETWVSCRLEIKPS